MEITSKQLWYKIYFADTYNRTISLSISEFKQQFDKLPERLYALRNIRGSMQPFILGSKTEIFQKISQIKQEDYLVSEKAPDDLIIIQGEYDGLSCRVTFDKSVMREAFSKDNHHISKLQLRLILGDEYYCLLQRLSMKFTDHVIEFSLYSRPVGIKSQRMIIWEIRKY